jgi:L-iditol 2-dehydrogenase
MSDFFIGLSPWLIQFFRGFSPMTGALYPSSAIFLLRRGACKFKIFRHALKAAYRFPDSRHQSFANSKRGFSCYFVLHAGYKRKVFKIPKTMRAAVYRGRNDLRVELVPVPRIGAHELLVKVAVCGVCPTDIKKIQYGTMPPPRIFGHETAGTIVRVGARVAGFHVGERVALHHHVPCLECHACRHHAFAQCETYKRTGITAGFEPAGGGFSEYVRVMSFVLPGVVKIPARNSFEEGAMLEPVNTVLKALKRLSLLPGDHVLVAGQGPIGLMFTRILQVQGMNVLATDLLENRLELARRFGAKWTMTVGGQSGKRESGKAETDQTVRSSRFKVQGLAAKDLELGTWNFERPPFDAAILAVPSDAALHQAMRLVRGGGQVLLFAHTKRGALTEIDLASVCVDEKDLIGSYSADFTLQKEVARLVFSRKLDVRPLISHRFELERTAAAVNLASKPTPDSMKILVVPGL